MGDLAEFGPLDVQVIDGEEIGKYNSGLSVFHALKYLQTESYSYFLKTLINLRNEGFSTKNAILVASNLTNGCFTPIVSQIDPVKIGELNRAIQIAIRYGSELITEQKGNINETNLWRLVMDYPDHGYVIDLKQAKAVFNNVREANELEERVALSLHEKIRYPANPGEKIVERIYLKETRDDNITTQQQDTRGTSEKKRRTAEVH